MKLTFTFTLFLLAGLSGPTLADTVADASNACSLVGPMGDATEDCRVMRVAYRTEVQDCMDKLSAEADLRAGKATGHNAHTSRARFLTCDALVRPKFYPVSQ